MTNPEILDELRRCRKNVFRAGKATVDIIGLSPQTYGLLVQILEEKK